MNDLMLFNNPDFGEVRTLAENGAVLFCGTDVAQALGYANPRDAIRTNCPHVVKRATGVQTGIKADGSPAMQTVEMSFIPESDLYRLVFRSKLPKAEEFTDWVTTEVLPSVRKTGGYTAKPMTTAEMFQLQAQINVEQERRIAALEEHQEKIIEACSVPSLGRDDWQESMKKYLAGLCEESGLNYSVMYGDLYAELERKMSCDLNARQRNMRRRLKAAGATYKERQKVSKLAVISKDEALAGAFEGIVQRYAARLAARKWEERTCLTRIS